MRRSRIRWSGWLGAVVVPGEFKEVLAKHFQTCEYSNSSYGQPKHHHAGESIKQLKGVHHGGCKPTEDDGHSHWHAQAPIQAADRGNKEKGFPSTNLSPAKKEVGELTKTNPPAELGIETGDLAQSLPEP